MNVAISFDQPEQAQAALSILSQKEEILEVLFLDSGDF